MGLVHGWLVGGLVGWRGLGVARLGGGEAWVWCSVVWVLLVVGWGVW
jgi:hypothetical protein